MATGEQRALAGELRCVAPLVTLASSPPALVGPCTLVTNGESAIAFSSAELLRRAPEPLAICTRLDASTTIPVTSWQLGGRAGIGVIEIPPGTPFSTDVHPLYLGAVYATLDTRSAPSALVAFRAAQGGFARRMIAVHVDNADPMGDDPIWLASPLDAGDADAAVDGVPLFTWLPPDPVLGRPSEVVLVALGLAHRPAAFQPREHPPIAELVGLDDVARALPWAEQTPPPRTGLEQIAGEIRPPTKQ